jgi:hypothetical protein
MQEPRPNAERRRAVARIRAAPGPRRTTSDETDVRANLMATSTTIDRDTSPRPAARFALRHLLIVFAYLAVLFKVVMPALRFSGLKAPSSLVAPVVLISPPLLALLVMVIERPGALRNWCVIFLNALFFPAVVLNHDFVALLGYLREGRAPVLWVTLVLNLVGFAWVSKYAGKLLPRICPSCQRRTLIPLIRLGKRESRSSKTSWCGSCGGKFWKDADQRWRSERRTTWLDALDESATVHDVVPTVGHGARPSAPHRPGGSHLASEVRTRSSAAGGRFREDHRS